MELTKLTDKMDKIHNHVEIVNQKPNEWRPCFFCTFAAFHSVPSLMAVSSVKQGQSRMFQLQWGPLSQPRTHNGVILILGLLCCERSRYGNPDLRQMYWLSVVPVQPRYQQGQSSNTMLCLSYAPQIIEIANIDLTKIIINCSIHQFTSLWIHSVPIVIRSSNLTGKDRTRFVYSHENTDEPFE